MKRLRHTLVSDGASDANLIPIIDWTLKEAGGIEIAEGVRAEFWRLPSPPSGLRDRICQAVDLFPCDVLFIHRDAERESPEVRHAEIRSAFCRAASTGLHLPAVAVVPVRMLEAWLLIDEKAIRQAAGNPNDTVPRGLPSLGRLEGRPDPKKDLRDALRAASGRRGRRLAKFDDGQAFWRLVDCMNDFTPLRQLRAYSIFEDSIRRMKARDWRPGFYGLE
jgi:hypothetical protein